jgi:hypothetical protein
MIEHVLIPVPQPIGIGSGELTPARKNLGPAPSIEIDEHHPSIEIFTMYVPVIAAREYMFRHGSQGSTVEGHLPQFFQAGENDRITVDEDGPLESARKNRRQQQAEIGSYSGMTARGLPACREWSIAAQCLR